MQNTGQFALRNKRAARVEKGQGRGLCHLSNPKQKGLEHVGDLTRKSRGQGSAL